MCWRRPSYAEPTLLHAAEGVVVEFGTVTAGVVQGSPMRGTPSMICIWTLIRQVEVQVRELPAIFMGVCADDLDMVRREVAHMKLLRRPFCDAAELMGAKLSPHKRKVVALAENASDGAIRRTLRELARIVPEWSELEVRGDTLYLGVVLGPRTEGEWVKQLFKWEARAATKPRWRTLA